MQYKESSHCSDWNDGGVKKRIEVGRGSRWQSSEYHDDVLDGAEKSAQDERLPRRVADEIKWLSKDDKLLNWKKTRRGR